MTFSRNEINKWYENFDTLKYPIQIYDELVWENYKSQNKIEILGAWKTGCLHVDNNSITPIYIDKNGTKYEYTKRWQRHTPVGFDIWKEISKNHNITLKNISNKLPTNKPKFLIDIEKKKGFGFIWGIFVLHCYYPKTYPLYDQHVYRAYKYIEEPDEKLPIKASYNWTDYLAYVSFFNKIVAKVHYHPSKVDRALWAYGKYLKILNLKMHVRNNVNSITHFLDTYEKGNTYCHLYTLGKQKSFWWKLDTDNSLIIIRRFSSGNTKINQEVFTKKELEEIQKYVCNYKKVPLANNVQKLNNNTEKDGLGNFIYNILSKNTTQAQLASHILSIFYYADIWDYNNKKRNILFWSKSNNWKNTLSFYYKTCINER